MKVKDIIKSVPYQCHTNSDLSPEVNGIYAGDLLSMVLANASAKNVFVTIQNNINAIAVSVLIEMPLIVFCHGLKPTEEMILKANEENITLLVSDADAATVILELHRLGI